MVVQVMLVFPRVVKVDHHGLGLSVWNFERVNRLLRITKHSFDVALHLVDSCLIEFFRNFLHFAFFCKHLIVVRAMLTGGPI